jgi:hypothetical protein
MRPNEMANLSGGALLSPVAELLSIVVVTAVYSVFDRLAAGRAPD